ncbi:MULTISPECIES: DUF4232 domain-containing protein [unclassified Streptomyces]|uniref:DUF4232 domain-containing protein n=1 Tax=unclassified Streptomyces TaxID=2593676 RepID=UPI0035D7F12D
MRTDRRTAVTIVAVLLASAAPTVAQASPAATSGTAPSACRPANHTAEITEAPAGSGHHHYRVTLTAPRGYDACELAGSPTGVRFSDRGTQTGVTAGRYGDQHTTVTFGPGHPVHFDVQVPDDTRQISADEASFTLQAPDGRIPGTSFAEGRLKVAAGTLIGPVLHGA